MDDQPPLGRYLRRQLRVSVKRQVATALALARSIAALAAVVVFALVLGTILVLGRQNAGQPADLTSGATPGATDAMPETPPVAAEPSGSAVMVLDIKRVENALEYAQAHLIEAYGITCFVQSDVLIFQPPDTGEKLDAQIDEAKVGAEAWLLPDRAWVGTSDVAAKAFGATRLYVDAQHLWMELSRNDRPVLLELVGVETPAGRTVWMPLNTVSPCEP